MWLNSQPLCLSSRRTAMISRVLTGQSLKWLRLVSAAKTLIFLKRPHSWEAISTEAIILFQLDFLLSQGSCFRGMMTIFWTICMKMANILSQLVLVNGFKGTGPAGWTSYIPCYNPRDIVENMKRLINDDKMVPMVPWYRGFTGTIEETVTNSGVCYTTCGIIEKEDESTLRITELPIGLCITDYLEFLGSISEEHGLAEDHKIKGYEDFSYIDVGILIHLSDTVKNLKEASKEVLCKTFKLTSRRSMNNMRLFNPKCKIKRYDTPGQILQEFFHLRLQFYEKRKTLLLLILRSQLTKLENKVAPMSGVLDGGVVDVNKLSTDLYLKNMPIITFVSRDSYPETLQELLADIDNIKLKVRKLEGSTPRALWLEDLAALKLELNKLEKQKFVG